MRYREISLHIIIFLSVISIHNAFSGSKVVTRAVFQLVAENLANRTSFEVTSLSSDISGDTIKLKFQPPADTCIGE